MQHAHIAKHAHERNVAPISRSTRLGVPVSLVVGRAHMDSPERDTRLCHNDDRQVEGNHAPQPIDEQPPLGEFMALYAAANGGALGLSSSSSSSPRADQRQDESIEKEAKAEEAPEKKQKKRVRYLRDTERHNIVKRIEKGEKQAALAREYGVTRAAICHIKKNRDEIVTRYDLLIQQTKEIDRAENFTNQPGEQLMVREIRSNPVLLLLTTLRDRRSDAATFRRAAGRLIMLLLEEALAVISAHAIEMTTSTGYLTYGLERTDEFCGVAVGAEGFPFLVLFHQMEPDAPQGSIHVELETDQQNRSEWRLDHMDLPSDVTRYRILLFSATVSTGGEECKAIETLCSVGVQEERITLVAILCSTDSLVAVCNRFPRVRTITSAIDSTIDPHTQEIIPGLGDFVSRYNDEFDQTLFSADAYTVASVLQSQNAGTAILQQALDEQRRAFGTGCTTTVTLCGVLAESVLELRRQGLPVDIIRQALASAERCCLATVKHMRVPLTEVIPSFDKLVWSRQLATLGRLLSINADKSIATSLAVEVASILDPVHFCGGEDFSLKDLVTLHVVLGGVTSATSSQVRGGVLLPIAEVAPQSCLRHRYSSATDGIIVIHGGIVALAGDLETTDFATDSSVQIVFVNGDISSQAIDASASTQNAALCIPVPSYATLRQLAEMSGAEIVDSWEELLPTAIGQECLHVKAIDLSVSKSQDYEDEDEFATFFLQIVAPNSNYQPHASVIVQGPTRSLAVELRDDTRRMISRLQNTLRSGYVLPGTGGMWCACAAAVALESEMQAKSDLELLSFATSRLVDPLTQLGVILLENSGGFDPNDTGNDSFFSRLARVCTVQKRFARGVLDVGATKFYSRYYNFRSADYALLSSQTTEPESEDGQLFHADEYKSTSVAVRSAFRVIQLLLNIHHHHVN
ncbi:hypothetical protein PRNP1_002690 [Phytophthora ramorum]